MSRRARGVAMSDAPALQVSFRKSLAFGPGKARLLTAIAETGSISAAAEQLGMSYHRAWDLVEELNRRFTRPLVLTQSGGQAGGGTAVTAVGFDVLSRYCRLVAQVHTALEDELADFMVLLAPQDAAESDDDSA